VSKSREAFEESEEKPWVPTIEQFRQLRGRMASLLGVGRVKRRQFDGLPVDARKLYPIALAVEKAGMAGRARAIKNAAAAREAR